MSYELDIFLLGMVAGAVATCVVLLIIQMVLV